MFGANIDNRLVDSTPILAIARPLAREIAPVTLNRAQLAVVSSLNIWSVLEGWGESQLSKLQKAERDRQLVRSALADPHPGVYTLGELMERNAERYALAQLRVQKLPADVRTRLFQPETIEQAYFLTCLRLEAGLWVGLDFDVHLTALNFPPIQFSYRRVSRLITVSSSRWCYRGAPGLMLLRDEFPSPAVVELFDRETWLEFVEGAIAQLIDLSHFEGLDIYFDRGPAGC